MTDYSGYLNISHSNAFYFLNASNNDMLIYPETSNQKVHIGITSNANSCIIINSNNTLFTTDTILSSNLTVSNVANFQSSVNVVGQLTVSNAVNIIDTTNNIFTLTEYNDTDGAVIRGRRARGTVAVPTALQTGDTITGLRAFGYNGSSFVGQIGAVNIVASSNYSVGNTGTYIAFGTTSNNSSTTAERMRIADNGNVGIGTTSPTQTFEVNGASANMMFSTGGGALIFSSNIANPGSSYAAMIARANGNGSYANDATNGDLVVRSQWNNVLLVPNQQTRGIASLCACSNGYIGIGTPSPAYLLDVTGTIRSSSAASSTYNMYMTSTVGSLALIANAGAGQANSITSAGDSMILFSGNTGIDTGNLVIAPWSSSGAGIRILGANGNVGIGVASPAYKLDVAASTHITSCYKFNDRTFVLGLVPTNRRYGLIASIGSNQGTARIILTAGGADAGFSGQGKCFIDLVIDGRSQTIKGTVNNHGLNTASGIVVYRNNTSGEFTVYLTGQHYFIYSLEVQNLTQTVVPTTITWSSDTAWTTPTGTTFWFDSTTQTAANSIHNLVYMSAANTPVNALTALNNGNVGIGTSNPAYALDVVNDIRTTGEIISTQNNVGKAYGFSKTISSGTTFWYKLATVTEGQIKASFNICGTVNYVHDFHKIDVNVTMDNISSDILSTIQHNTANYQQGTHIWSYIDFVVVTEASTKTHLYMKVAPPAAAMSVAFDITATSKNISGSTPVVFYPNTSFTLAFAGTMTTAIDTSLTGALGSYTVSTNANTKYLRLMDQNGNVGIGTSNPAYKLDVAGNICTNNNNVFLSTSSGVVTDGTYGIYWNGGNTQQYGIYRSSGAWSAPNYQQLLLNWTTGITLNPGTAYGKSYVDIQGNGLRVTSGNVGIGTSSPSASYKLDVQGNGRFTDKVWIGTTSGTETLNVNGSIGVTGTTITNSSGSGIINTTSVNATTFTGSLVGNHTSGNIAIGAGTVGCGAVTSTAVYSPVIQRVNPIATYNIGSYVDSAVLQIGYSGGDNPPNGDGGKYVTAGSVGLKAQNLTWAVGEAAAPKGSEIYLESGRSPLGGIVHGSIHLRTGGSTYTTGITRMTVDGNSGYVGIGTTSPSYNLHVVGNIYATGNITAFSDSNYKKDLVYIDNALDKIDKLNGYTFSFKEETGSPDASSPDASSPDASTQRYAGLLAQEVREVLPEAVMEDKDGKLSVAYGNMMALAINAIKELKAEINAIKQNINLK